MNFLIADTFTDSLNRLTADEQKAAKTTAFDLQLNPAAPGLKFHKLEKAKDKSFWSIRAGSDIRLIVHKSQGSLLLCYVDHHDSAYRWAERRKLEQHPKTGAAQLVEIRETVQEIAIPRYVEVDRPSPAKPRLFSGVSDNELLGYGVPDEWLADVRQATEETLLELSDHLPREAAEALFDLATGAKPQVVQPAVAGTDPFDHPDAKRRFRVMTNVEELERALDYPWEKWTVFLHPAQRDLVERRYNGPARVSGSAGTGKTVVALHRAVFLARKNPAARVLVTTFSDTLAHALRTKIRLLVGNEPAVFDRTVVHALTEVGCQLYAETLGPPQIADVATIRQLLTDAGKVVPGHRFSGHFLWTEWNEVVDAWQLDSWEAYRDVARIGRKTRLREPQRQMLWDIFSRVRDELDSRKLLTHAAVLSHATERLGDEKSRPYDFVVVDEAQDIGVPQLRFLAQLGCSRPESLFFAGDLGQRIFQPPFSWKSLGVDIRGRSHTLRINYRTSHQIRRQADRLLPPELADVDGNAEQRKGTISVFNGPDPSIKVFATEKAEIDAVGQWLKNLHAERVGSHEIGVFVRTADLIDRAWNAVKAAGLNAVELDETVETQTEHVSIGTMHLAKGLEFRAVVVMACDDEIIPLQERIEAVGDEADLEDVYTTERQLFYVACTRAREYLLVTGVTPASEFLDDLRV